MWMCVCICVFALTQVGENMGPEAAGMRVKLIDTVGLEDAESGDAVNLTVSQEGSVRTTIWHTLRHFGYIYIHTTSAAVLSPPLCGHRFDAVNWPQAVILQVPISQRFALGRQCLKQR
jgi:hypothetical protein